MATPETPALLTEREVAAWLRVHPRTLIRWRQQGLPHVAMHQGTARVRIRYRPGEVAAWLMAQSRGSTLAPAPGPLPAPQPRKAGRPRRQVAP